MSRYFFITGLPRSRTAWLSCFFTHGNVACRHEALRHDLSALGLRKTLDETPGEYAGDSDSALPLMAAQIGRMFPEAPVAVVRRSPTECRESLERVYGSEDLANLAVDQTLRGLDVLSGCMKTREFDYARLPADLREMWEFLVPGEPFPEWRVNELLDLQIEQRTQELMRGSEWL